MNEAVFPHSLVMRRRQCEYCEMSSTDEESVGITMIMWMFGIYRCTEHKAVAERDCNAYCHMNGIVDMRRAKHMPVIAALLAELSTIRVLRSNGAIEEDWTLYYGSHTNPVFLTNDERRGWHIPVISPDGLTKVVPIATIAKETVAILAAIAALDAGVYAEDALGFRNATLRQVEETAGVVEIHQGGVSTNSPP